MAIYTPVDSQVWKGRIDGDGADVLRWHQVMQVVNLDTASLPVIQEHQQGIAFIGFCCDEGVRRNNGRLGAAKAPAAIRTASCNFPLIASHIHMVDAGDVYCPDGDLQAAQPRAAARPSSPARSPAGSPTSRKASRSACSWATWIRSATGATPRTTSACSG